MTIWRWRRFEEPAVRLDDDDLFKLAYERTDLCAMRLGSMRE